VVGAALSVWSVGDLNAGRSGPHGIIDVLPITFFAGLGVVLVAFTTTLRRQTLPHPVLAFQLITIISLLYGLTSYAEDIARLPTTWVHAGLIEYIQRTGAVLPDYDARFAWPAFFAGGALLNDLAGTDDSGTFLSWAPLVLNLTYSVPVWTIARGTGASARRAWLATCLFFLLNWVAQDYYSPQGVNFLFATAILAVLIRAFTTKSEVIPAWIARPVGRVLASRFSRRARLVRRTNLGPVAQSEMPVSGRQRVLLLSAVALLFAASVVSHQLTPFLVLITVIGLVVLDRVSTRLLPVLMLLGVLIWISYAASSYWAGQLDSLFADVGKIDSVVNQNVNNRVAGNPDHKPVIYARLALTATLWLTAGVGLLRLALRGKLDVISIVGFVAPFTVLVGQAYGGEALLRVYLFALPFAATLAAAALAPGDGSWGKRTTALVTVVLLALMPAFFLTRYGNEAFESFVSDELATVDELSRIAPPGSSLFVFNTNVPWRKERIEDYTFRPLFEDTIPANEIAVISDALQPAGDVGSFLLVTTAQERFAEIKQGQDRGWVDSTITKLLATNRYRVVHRSSDGLIIVPAEPA